MARFNKLFAVHMWKVYTVPRYCRCYCCLCGSSSGTRRSQQTHKCSSLFGWRKKKTCSILDHPGSLLESRAFLAFFLTRTHKFHTCVRCNRRKKHSQTHTQTRTPSLCLWCTNTESPMPLENDRKHQKERNVKLQQRQRRAPYTL